MTGSYFFEVFFLIIYIYAYRFVTGTASVAETIRELEDEYHENTRFGLADKAQTIADLLEWSCHYPIH